MVWSANDGVSIILPTDHVDGDGRNYIVIGEDVPTEIATQYTAALVFYNGGFNANNPDGMYPNGFVYSVIGFAKSGALEITMYYYVVSAPTGGGIQYYRQTILSVSPPVGVDNPPVLSLGENPKYGSYNEGAVSVVINSDDTGWKSAGPINYRVKNGWCSIAAWSLLSNGWAASTLFATLPVGAQPSEQYWFPANISGDSTRWCLVKLDTNGQITLMGAASGSNDIRIAFSFPVA